uniref:Uncharacterized protein n=1 Tax=Anguilla anguilla TaxID=7936 RepID=A0A0E9P7B9_ANGAN
MGLLIGSNPCHSLSSFTQSVNWAKGHFVVGLGAGNRFLHNRNVNHSF